MRNLMIETDDSTELSVKPSRLSKKFCFMYSFGSVVIGLVIGVSLTYSVLRDRQSSNQIIPAPRYEEDIRKSLFKNIESERIGVWLKTLTKRPITGETYLDENTLYVYNKWTELGLKTSFSNYSVLLSYQNTDKPNSVSKFDKSGQIIHNSSQFEDALNAPPDVAKYYRLNPPFLAYSHSTETPLKGIPVYVNYGRAEDYDYLKKINVSVGGNIVIARYAKIFRANIVQLAEDNGAIGAVIYSDPYDYTDGDTRNTYPHSVYLPASGVQRGTVQMGDGDPQTPFYPSIESAYRVTVNESNIPRIPVQSIGYADAKYIMEGLSGPAAPDSWVGKLNITYNIGAGYEDESYLTLEVNTYLKRSVIHNVIGMITGCTEPDRYVLVGNHRDAWTFGAADPLSGTAAMLELSEAFTAVMNAEKWCPRRSIVFCSWAAEEYGLIGSTEWVEENQKSLQSQAIAYLNVDIAVEGNYTFQADGVPLLYRTIWEATKTVDNPNAEEVENGFKTVYESYLLHRPSNISDAYNYPDIKTPGSGSDHSPFLQITGTPVVNFYYDCDQRTGIKCYPLYHSMYETYDLMANLTDRGFKYSKALTQVWAEMLRSLSDTPLLPFSDSIDFYPNFLKNAFNELNVSQYKDILDENNISLNFLYKSIDEFEDAISIFDYQIRQIDENEPLTLRRVNDILMLIERAFIEGQGLPQRKDFKHIVLAPSSLDSYSGSSFAGLYDLLWHYRHETNESNKPKILADIRKHLSVIVFHINSAKLLVSQSYLIVESR